MYVKIHVSQDLVTYVLQKHDRDYNGHVTCEYNSVNKCACMQNHTGIHMLVPYAHFLGEGTLIQKIVRI